MSLYLGIDGGGTKTAAAILDDDGAELGRGYGGTGNIASTSDADLLHTVQTAVGGACAEAAIPPASVRFHGVCAAMAGVSVPGRLRTFDALLRAAVPAASYRIEPDFVAAYWGAASGEPGIAVIAGTGAVSYGRNAEGVTCREDGLGFLLGDRGSGFDLGLRILRHAVDRLAAGQLDALAEATLASTDTHTQSEIVEWLYTDFRPARVAALAPLAGELAEQGDTAARHHVAAVALQLRRSVIQVRHRLSLPHDTPIYPLGGLWGLGRFFRNEFVDPRQRQGSVSGSSSFARAAEAAATRARSRPAPTEFSVSAGRLCVRVAAILIARHRDRQPESMEGGSFHIASPRRDAAYGAALLASYPDRPERPPDDFARRLEAAREDGAGGL